jgi:hypothetical protein
MEGVLVSPEEFTVFDPDCMESVRRFLESSEPATGRLMILPAGMTFCQFETCTFDQGEGI